MDGLYLMIDKNEEKGREHDACDPFSMAAYRLSATRKGWCFMTVYNKFSLTTYFSLYYIRQGVYIQHVKAEDFQEIGRAG